MSARTFWIVASLIIGVIAGVIAALCGASLLGCIVAGVVYAAAVFFIGCLLVVGARGLEKERYGRD